MKRIQSSTTLQVLQHFFAKHKTIVATLCLGGIFLVYVAVNWQFVGPQYLSDELGYLTKAIAIAGFAVDNATKWHGGYSLLLAPLFSVFSNPKVIWHAIVVMNAAMFTTAFAVLFHILRRIFPDEKYWLTLLVVALTALYPSWVVMTGYAFSTPMFVLLFMLTLLSFMRIDVARHQTLLLPGVLVGLLYWIHPIGLVVLLAGLITLLAVGVPRRSYKSVGIFTLTAIAIAATYKFGVQPWLVDISSSSTTITGGGYQVAGKLDRFANLESIVDILVVAAGQISYLFVATFGMALFAVERIVRGLVSAWRTKRPLDSSQATLLFILLSCLGALAVSAVFLSGSLDNGVRTDTVIYGRYTELVLLPLVAIGVLSKWRVGRLLVAAGFVLLTGLDLHLTTNLPTPLNNTVNTVSFWPQFLLPSAGYLWWMVAGVVALVLIVFATKRKYLALLLVVPLALVAIDGQIDRHHKGFASYSAPSSELISYVNENYAPSTCIGHSEVKEERIGMAKYENIYKYKYYLFRYAVRGMTADEWLDSDCELYMTYDPDILTNHDQAEVALILDEYGLYVLTQRD